MLIILLYTLCIIAVAAGIYGLINQKHLRKSFKWLSILLLSQGIIQYTAYLFILIFKSNILLYNVATLFYFLVMFIVFANFTKSKSVLVFNNILFTIGGVAVLTLIAIAIYNNSVAIAAITISSFVFSLASMVFLLDMIRTPGTQSPFKTAKIYALAGILVYYSAIIFFWAYKKISASMNYEIPTENILRAEYINQIMLIIFYVIIFISLVVEKKDVVKDEF